MAACLYLFVTVCMLGKIKNNVFLRGCSYFSSCLRGLPSLSNMKFCQEILETLCYHTVKNRKSLTYLGLDRYLDMPAGQTDGRTEGQNYGS